MFENLRTDPKRNLNEFTFKGVDVSIVNSIRRTILSEIPNVAFYFDVQCTDPKNSNIIIEKNDTPINNEFLSQRFSMIPIHLKKDDIDTWDDNKYSFTIDASNPSNRFKAVTTRDIRVFDRNGNQLNETGFFPKNKVTNDYILLSKLPPRKDENDDNIPSLKVKLIATKNIPAKHICFSSVSLATYHNSIDNEALEKNRKAYVESFLLQNDSESTDVNELKLSAERRFNALEYQRSFKVNSFNEPCEFNFMIETEGRMSFSEIFEQAIDILIDKISDLHIENSFNETKIVLLEKNFIDESKGYMYVFEFKNETHTLGNLLQSLIYNAHVRKQTSINYVGYFMPHPLDERFILKITTSHDDEALRNILINSFLNIEALFRDIKSKWRQFIIQSLDE